MPVAQPTHAATQFQAIAATSLLPANEGFIRPSEDEIATADPLKPALEQLLPEFREAIKDLFGVDILVP